MILGFDYIGWDAVVAAGVFAIPFTIAMYARESRGRRRPSQMSRWRSGIWGACFAMLIACVRRFVLHQ